ncbi:MAG: hypothetical protein JST54_16605 [Deltaproteobacteria bacterium]|nr:hypothetical protein [Deltaproteobacteria bacterium]
MLSSVVTPISTVPVDPEPPVLLPPLPQVPVALELPLDALAPLELLAVDAALLELEVAELELLLVDDDDDVLPEEDEALEPLPPELLELELLEVLALDAIPEPELAPCPLDDALELVPRGGQRVTSKPGVAQ